MFGPAGLPQSVVRRINAAINKALDSAELRAFYARQNALIIGGTPEELAATVKRDWEITAKLIKTLGLQAE